MTFSYSYMIASFGGTTHTYYPLLMAGVQLELDTIFGILTANSGVASSNTNFMVLQANNHAYVNVNTALSVVSANLPLSQPFRIDITGRDPFMMFPGDCLFAYTQGGTHTGIVMVRYVIP